MDQVDAEHTERILLVFGGGGGEVSLNHEAGRFFARTRLKSDPEPAVSFAGFTMAAGGYGIGEGEEPLAIATGGTEAVEQLSELQFQHRLQAFPTHIVLCRTIKGITNRHVIG